jgi:hypothetical protein
MLTKTKAGLAAETARGVVTDRKVRSAALETTRSMGKLSFAVGRRFARRRTRTQTQRLEDQIESLAALIGTYRVTLAQLGAIERQKPKRTGPRIATGVVIGAGMMYLLEPGSGAVHRRQLGRLVSGLVS